MSRGRPCVISDNGGQATSRNPCPWTSGRLAAGAHLETPPNGDTLDIDLGSDRSISYLTLRDNDDLGTVQVSPDRSTWRPVSARSDFKTSNNLGASLPPGTRGRWVRITFSGFDTAFLDQVGLWP
jgi:hypothetical protein